MMQSSPYPPFKRYKRECERSYVTALLRYTEGNIAAAARIAEKDRKDFYDLMRRCGVQAGEFRCKRRRKHHDLR